MTAYYNEFDPQAAAWLRELIKAGLIAPGKVDERSIADVKANDLRGFTQCHFFAGIGGWSYALRLAGWSDDRPVWTGSPPCQPFSNAGKQKAQADARHLWPVFFNLVRECKPANIFGEQVEAAIRTGWLDDLQDDLEAENYATGKIVLPACSVGAPHIRQRIIFVAERLEHAELQCERSAGQQPQRIGHAFGASKIIGLADTNDTRSQGRAGVPSADKRTIGAGSLASGLAYSDSKQNDTTDPRGLHAESCSESRDGRLAESEKHRLQGSGATKNSGGGSSENGQSDKSAGTIALCGSGIESANAHETFWSNPDWLFCRDGKWRPAPTECKFLLLADGFWYRMDSVLSELIKKTVKGVFYYAKTARILPREALQNVWGDNDPEAIRQEIAGQGGIYKAEILRLILRGESAVGKESEPERSSEPEKSAEADARVLRDLREQLAVECPSLRRKPLEQQQRESANPLSELSQLLAQSEQAYESYSARKNEGGFPLAGKCVGRVGLLRGYGNAIVPEVAAEVIRAYMEGRA